MLDLTGCAATCASLPEPVVRCLGTAAEGTSATAGGGGTNSCEGFELCDWSSTGQGCSLDVDCTGVDEHGTGGMCYENTQGSQCDLDVDCGAGNHCSEGCCYSDATDNPCDLGDDCFGACVGGCCS